MIRQKFPWKGENDTPSEWFDLDRIVKCTSTLEDTQPVNLRMVFGSGSQKKGFTANHSFSFTSIARMLLAYVRSGVTGQSGETDISVRDTKV